METMQLNLPHVPATRQATETRVTTSGSPDLIEIWGDTVQGSHLVWALIIGASISLSGYYLAGEGLKLAVQSPQMVHAYTMLGGVVGCLIAGCISAALFKPKRTITSLGSKSEWQQAVLDELEAEHGSLGSLSDLSECTIKELKEVRLYDLFASRQVEPTKTR